jgi:hypothetical protein
MAHSILGQRFAQQDLRRPPWHELQSAVLRPQTNVSEALGLIDGDFLVEKAPLYVYYAQRGIRVEDQFALVRPALTDQPEPEVLGIVGKDYELIQHGEVARALDPLVDQANGWVVETLGILNGGAQFFATFNAEGFVVNEDDIDVYWVVSEYKGRSSLDIFSAHTRVVCQNTYRIAEGQALQRLAIPHYRGARQELDFAVQVLAAAECHKQEFKDQLEQMGRTALVEQQVQAILRQTYLEPAPPRRVKFIDELSKNAGFLNVSPSIQAEYAALQQSWLQERDRTERTRQAVYERYDIFGQERRRYAGTAWALWNAVTEVENYKTGKGRGASTLFGSRAETMQRAYSRLLESMN